MEHCPALTGWRQYAWAALVAFPSIFVVYRFVSPAAVYVYCAGVLLAVRFGYEPICRALCGRLSQQAGDRIAVALLLGLAWLAVVAYPWLNAGWGSTRGGTDRDDALILLVKECLAGRYPYYAVTYGGNPISPMPGAGLLALPFVVTHAIVLQTVLWLGLSLRGLRRALAHDVRLPLFVLLSLLVLSPEVLRDVATGDDMLVNALYVAVAFAWFLTTASRRRPPWPSLLGASVLLGIALSSRGLYLLTVPLVFCHLYRQVGYRRAVVCVGGVLGSFALITLPFYLYDPAAFSPLHHTLGKLHLPPSGCWFIIGLMLFVSACLGLGMRGQRLSGFFERASLVLLLPVLAGSLAAVVAGDTWHGLDNLSHAVAVTAFGAAALCLRQAERPLVPDGILQEWPESLPGVGAPGGMAVTS